MGLAKTETKYGQTAEYWVIVDFPSNMIVRRGNVELLGYFDRQTYKDHPRQGNPKWARRTYNIPTEDFEPLYFAALDSNYPANLHEMLYAYVMQDESVLPTREDGTQITGAVENPANPDAPTWFADAAPVHEDTA